MTVIYEHSEDEPLALGETDGVQEFLAELDEPTSTDWDAMVENPPHEGMENVVMPHLAKTVNVKTE